MKLLYGLWQKDWEDTVFDRTELILFSKFLAEVIGCGIILSSVRLSVCNALHSGSQHWCTGLKVVPACSWQVSSYLSVHMLSDTFPVGCRPIV